MDPDYRAELGRASARVNSLADQYIIAPASRPDWVIIRHVNLRDIKHKVSDAILPPLAGSLIRLIWKTCRVERVLGTEHLQQLLAQGGSFIPCYWHQQQLFCVHQLLETAQQHPALKLGYLISPSGDGDKAARTFADLGLHIIRGSATRGGALALKEIYTTIRQHNVSPIITPDGPTGPIFKCKPGVPMIAHLSRVPLLPMAYAASHVITLRSWDRFLLPLPFSRIVVGISAPIEVDTADARSHYQLSCSQLEAALAQIEQDCRSSIKQAD